MEEKKYQRAIEIWSDLTVSISDFDRGTGEPISGVLISVTGEGKQAGSMEDGALYIAQDELPAFIEALQEFVQ